MLRERTLRVHPKGSLKGFLRDQAFVVSNFGCWGLELRGLGFKPLKLKVPRLTVAELGVLQFRVLRFRVLGLRKSELLVFQV